MHKLFVEGNSLETPAHLLSKKDIDALKGISSEINHTEIPDVVLFTYHHMKHANGADVDTIFAEAYFRLLALEKACRNLEEREYVERLHAIVIRILLNMMTA